MKADAVYSPLCTLKPVAPEVWVVDGPIIRFGPVWPKMPFPTRMTVVRLADDRLLIHSPVPLPARLNDELSALGRPCWIVGPNRLPYWWIPEWHVAFPDAAVYLAPRIARQARGGLIFPACPWTRRVVYRGTPKSPPWRSKAGI